MILVLLVVNLIAISAFAQSVTITGTVRNSITKDPVPSVSVVVKGSSTGTFTNENGEFKISVEKLPVQLFFSSIGYEMQEVTVSNGECRNYS